MIKIRKTDITGNIYPTDHIQIFLNQQKCVLCSSKHIEKNILSSIIPKNQTLEKTQMDKFFVACFYNTMGYYTAVKVITIQNEYKDSQI